MANFFYSAKSFIGFEQATCTSYVQNLSGQHDQSFLSFFEQEVLKGQRLKTTTRKNYLSTFKHLSSFAPNLQFEDLTFQFVNGFEQYLESKLLQRSTIAKHLRHLKRFINLAIQQDLVCFNSHPFQKYKIQQGNSRRVYLTPAELARIEKMPLHGNKGLSRCRDLFLFSCYTGLRFSDIVRLKVQNFSYVGKALYLKVFTQKTNAYIELPLLHLFLGKSIPLYNKYKHNKQTELFGLSKNSNSNINKLLKQLARKANIKKKLTFHVARHTFATLLLYSGTYITTVQKLLGHNSVRTTEIYSDIMDMTVIRDLKRTSKKL